MLYSEYAFFINTRITSCTSVSVTAMKRLVRQNNFGTSLNNISTAYIRFTTNSKLAKQFGVSVDTFRVSPQSRGWCVQDTVEL